MHKNFKSTIKEMLVTQKKLVLLIFSFLLIFQVFTYVQIARDKKEFHIDEIYTYILSNSYDADRVANADEYFDVWRDGEDFNEFITVQPGERFAYDKVYRNNSLDAHPPLFYFFVHTLSSLFPNRFSKWFVLSINILAFVISQIFLFRLSLKIFGKNMWALVPAAVYGGTLLAIDTVNFMRMYILLTMFTVILAYIHYNLLTRDIRARDYILCFAVTFLGVFTQYYFAVSAFFMAAAFCIWLLANKKIKSLVFYALCMLSGVVLVFGVYPAGIKQITGSSTNNIGNEVARSILDFSNFSTRFQEFTDNLKEGAFLGVNQKKWLIVYIVIASAMLSVALYKNRTDEQENQPCRKPLWALVVCLAAIVFLTIATISHTSGSYSYVRYVYHIVPLVCLTAALLLYLALSYAPVKSQVIAVGLVLAFVFSTSSLAANKSATYLYRDYADNLKTKIIAECKDKPLIVVNNSSNYFLTANLTVFNKCNNVYVLVLDDDTDIDSVLSQKQSKGYVFMVLTDGNWSKGFDGDKVMTDFVEKSNIISSYSRYSICRFGTVYTAE